MYDYEGILCFAYDDVDDGDDDGYAEEYLVARIWFLLLKGESNSILYRQ